MITILLSMHEAHAHTWLNCALIMSQRVVIIIYAVHKDETPLYIAVINSQHGMTPRCSSASAHTAPSLQDFTYMYIYSLVDELKLTIFTPMH